MAALIAGNAAGAFAQATVRAENVRVGSAAERYLRALSLTLPSDSTRWISRPLRAAPLVVTLARSAGPWGVDTSTRRWSVSAGVDLTLNTERPTPQRDGSAWTGRGLNLRSFASIDWRRAGFSVRVAPVAWWAQNAAFELLPTFGPGNPYRDPLRPITIDLPQRFGPGAVARLDPGESEIAWEGERLKVALTSAAAHLGPASDHSLLLQGDAGGYPRAVVSAGRLDTRVGDFTGEISWGRVAQSGFAYQQRAGALYTSYISGTWRPAGISGRNVEIGMTRLTDIDWETLQLRDLLVPFGSISETRVAGGTPRDDNQMASVFARMRVPGIGVEFFTEYAKNDRGKSMRDYILEAEHGAAWLLGMQRAWRRDGMLWALNMTAVSGSISRITDFRFQSTFYDHFPLTQGHTLRGQLLGTPLLEREGGAELRLDRYHGGGAESLILGTRSLNNEYAATVAPENLRQEWSAIFEVLRSRREGVWRWRVGGIADLGYSPVSGDAYSLHLSLGYSGGR